MVAKHPGNSIDFLMNDGEMGRLTREKDWSQTSLGAPQTWPQSLRTTLSLLLHSGFPMVLFWGPDLICFYNDAFRPSLGKEGKHPGMLGMKGEEAWSEIWSTIKPWIDDVIKESKSIWKEDLLVPIYRNGKIEDVYWTFSYSPVHDETGKPAGVFVAVVETTDKLLLYNKLEESKNQLEFAIEATQLGTWDYNPLTHKFASNHRLKKWCGLEVHEEIELSHVVTALHESDRQRVTEAIQKCLDYSSGGKYDIEYTLVHPVSKNETIVHAKGRAWFNNEKIAYRFNGTLEDITEQAIARKHIEETQRQLRKELADTQRLYKVSNQLIHDDKIEILYQNIVETAMALLEADCASLQLLNPHNNELTLLAWKGFHPSSAEFWSTVKFASASTCGQALQRAQRVIVDDIETNELMIGTEDQDHYRLCGIRSVQSTPLISRVGHMVGMISTHWKKVSHVSEKNLQLLDVLARLATDLIERKQTEEEIKGIVAQFNALADNAPNLAWMAKADGWIYWYNKKWYEYTGTSPEQMEGWGWQSVHDPERLPHVLKHWHESIASGLSFEMIFPLKGANGKFRQFLTRMLPIKNNEGKILQWVGSNTDITDLLETQDLLKESENRYRSLADGIPMMSFIIEPNSEATVSYWNKTWLDYTGQTYEQALGRSWDGIIHPDDLQQVLDIYAPAFEKQQSYYIPAIRVKRYDGAFRWHLFMGNPRYLPDGTFMGYIGIGFDIHDQKLTQDALIESEERFRIFSNNIQNLAWIAEGDGNILWYNQRWLDYTGLTLEEMKGWGWQKVHHPDHLERVIEISKQLWMTNEPFELTFPLRRADGEYRWFLTRGVPILDSHGKIYRWIGTNTDIDDKVKAENQLKEREEKFSSLVQTLPQLIWVTDEKGNAEFTSFRWKEYSGIEPAAEKEWKAIVHPEDYDKINAAWIKSLTTGNRYTAEVRLKNKEGQYRWHSVKGEPVLDKDNKIIKWVGAFTDIHSEKIFANELEEKVASRTAELKESEEKFYNLFNLSPICKTLSDANTGKILMVNDAFTKVFGFSSEEVFDKTAAELGLLDPQSRGVIVDQMKEIGKVQNIELDFIKKSGEKFCGLTSAEFIIINDKQYILGAVNDITARKKAEQNIELKNIQLQKLNKELQSFAYISSHDLQEPLRKIQTFASRITEKEEANLSAIGKDHFKRMQDAAKRMQTLIQDLLAYSRTNTMEYQFEFTDLNKVVTEVRDDLKEELNEKQATLEVAELCETNIIPFQFRQLMHNLIGNALKFSIPTQPPHIIIKSEIATGIEFNNTKLSPQKKYCHISVSDNGIGFEQEYNEKIFELFQRLHGKSEYPGTGIGLSIVKKIVENHGGIIIANSELNKGATFDIYIPAT